MRKYKNIVKSNNNSEKCESAKVTGTFKPLHLLLFTTLFNFRTFNLLLFFALLMVTAVASAAAKQLPRDFYPSSLEENHVDNLAAHDLSTGAAEGQMLYWDNTAGSWAATDATKLKWTAATDTLSATNVTASGTGTFGQIIDSGLTASLGVYTDASKQLTSTAPTSGVLGYWSRATTTLDTANAGDNVNLTGTLASGEHTLSGHLLFSAETYNIGAAAVNRPNYIYAKANITAGGQFLGNSLGDPTIQSYGFAGAPGGMYSWDGGDGIAFSFTEAGADVLRMVIGEDAVTLSDNINLTLGGAGTVTIGTLVLAAGSITDTSDNISFGNENIITTGSITATGCSVLGLNSAVFQPATDSTTFFQVLNQDGGTPILNIDSTNERVGIGTVTPDMSLEISDKNVAPFTVGIHLDGLNNTIFRIDRGRADRISEIQFETAGLDKWVVGLADSDLLGEGTEFFIGLSSGGINSKIVIETTGNVGIGTTAPDTKLQVVGNAGFGDDAGNETLFSATGSITQVGSATAFLHGLGLQTTRVTASPYAVLATDDEIFVDTDSGAITVNLPAGIDGKRYRVINSGSSGNDVTLNAYNAGDGTETLRGANSQTISDSEIMILTFETTENWW